MCRVFGAVASDPISVRHELVGSSNPMIRLSEDHDSGWGMATYRDVGQAAPLTERFPIAAHADGRFTPATEMRGRIFNVHVRRATLGGLCDENTHPFEFGPYSFAHNGTILNYRSILRPGMADPQGQTDSECFFMRMINDFDPIEPVRSIRGVVAAIAAAHTFSGLNFVFSDGMKLYAYRLGIFDLFWTTRQGVALVSSEQLTTEPWHAVQQDVLLTLDPENPEEVQAERLLGDMMLHAARIERLEPDASLKGDARGQWAERFATEVAGRAPAPSLNGRGGAAVSV